jgi:hypothetical protein
MLQGSGLSAVAYLSQETISDHSGINRVSDRQHSLQDLCVWPFPEIFQLKRVEVLFFCISDVLG